MTMSMTESCVRSVTEWYAEQVQSTSKLLDQNKAPSDLVGQSWLDRIIPTEDFDPLLVLAAQHGELAERSIEPIMRAWIDMNRVDHDWDVIEAAAKATLLLDAAAKINASADQGLEFVRRAGLIESTEEVEMAA